MESNVSRNCLNLTSAQRRTLERWARGRTTPQRLVLRSRIVLCLADGSSHTEAAALLNTTRHTVRLWKERFIGGGPEALALDASGRGRKPRLAPGAVAEAVKAADGRRPSVRQLARQLGVSASSVHRALVDERHQGPAKAP